MVAICGVAVRPSWYWLYDNMEDEGFEVKLSHRPKIKAIAYAKVKTDKVGSVTLAHLLSGRPLAQINGGAINPFSIFLTQISAIPLILSTSL